jgi:hypothetical protein
VLSADELLAVTESVANEGSSDDATINTPPKDSRFEAGA